MNSAFSKVLIFVTGAAIGSIITWKIVETKYKKLTQDEIDSVKKSFSRMYCDNNQLEEDSDNEYFVHESTDHNADTAGETHNEDVKRYMDILTETQYMAEEAIRSCTNPYLIAPQELGEIDGYEVQTLVYYADGVLTDEADNPIEDVDDAVGNDFHKYFGVYEDDAVHIRNDTRKIDYEVLIDLRKYSDVVTARKHQMEGE